MANEIIKPHKFEVSKNKIHSLSKSVSNVSLQKFPTQGSIFSWNDHNITGNEANTLLVSPLQSALISQNTSIRSLFNIADEVYNALESLDKEYIQGIIAAVKSAEIASNQAKAASSKASTASNQALEASRKALDASTKATVAQADIKRTIEALQTTVKILKQFKEKVTKDLSSIASLNTRITSVNSKILDVENKICDVADSAKKIKDFQPIFSNLNHIKDVDQIWNDLKSCREVIKGLINTLTPFMSRVNDADKELHREINIISTLLESYQHLGDIDTIWNDVEGHKKDLYSIHQQVDTFGEKVDQATARINSDIEALKQFRTLLESYNHLGDIDTIWNDVEGHKKDLYSFHQQVDTFVEKVDQATARINSDIEALKQYRTLLESYQHLGDIDTIWIDVEVHKKDLSSFHQQFDSFVEDAHKSTARISADINTLQKFRTLLEAYHHLGDIDTIWNDVEGHKKDLSSFHLQVDNFVEKINQSTARINADIEALQKFRTLLESYQHLGDIDAIWSDVETLKKEYFDLHLNLSSFIEATNSEQEKIKETIHQMEIENNLVRQQYDKRMKIAYWIGGCAVGLTIVNYVLQFIGIL